MKIKSFLYNFILLIKYTLGNTKIYHYGKSKSPLLIFKELFIWLLKNKNFNKMYYAFGLNLFNRNSENYIDKSEVAYYKNKVEYKLRYEANNKLNYEVITKDKFYASAILQANNIKTIKTLAILYKDKFIIDDKVKKLDEIFKLGYPFVLKNNIIEAGEGIFIGKFQDNKLFINDKVVDSIEELKKILGKSVWILQKKIVSIKQIRQINSTALNTTRIVTILDGSQPVYLTGFQAFATNESSIDSWSKGSIYVGIDPQKNRLKKYGYYNPWVKGKTIVTKHPDSNLKFEDYNIPYLKDAVELCLYAHNIFFYNFMLGWDVAITDDGPYILEVNENPGMNAVQCLDGGLKEKIRYYANKYLNIKR